MRSYKSCLMLFLLICLAIDTTAQDTTPVRGPYAFLRKGAPSPYDSGVVIEIHTYRQIRRKVTLADSLIEGLNIERIQFAEISLKKDSTITSLTAITERQAATIQHDQAVKDELNKNYNALFIIANKKRKWYERPGVIFGGGLLAGILITKI
jgi:hypothetical protein